MSESSETRFGKVSSRTELRFRDKRPFKFSRKARSYTRAYFELSNGLDLRALDRSEIERVAKKQKAHRGIAARCSFITHC